MLGAPPDRGDDVFARVDDVAFDAHEISGALPDDPFPADLSALRATIAFFTERRIRIQAVVPEVDGAEQAKQLLQAAGATTTSTTMGAGVRASLFGIAMQRAQRLQRIAIVTDNSFVHEQVEQLDNPVLVMLPLEALPARARLAHRMMAVPPPPPPPPPPGALRITEGERLELFQGGLGAGPDLVALANVPGMVRRVHALDPVLDPVPRPLSLFVLEDALHAAGDPRAVKSPDVELLSQRSDAAVALFLDGRDAGVQLSVRNGKLVWPIVDPRVYWRIKHAVNLVRRFLVRPPRDELAVVARLWLATHPAGACFAVYPEQPGAAAVEVACSVKAIPRLFECLYALQDALRDLPAAVAAADAGRGGGDSPAERLLSLIGAARARYVIEASVGLCARYEFKVAQLPSPGSAHRPAAQLLAVMRLPTGGHGDAHVFLHRGNIATAMWVDAIALPDTDQLRMDMGAASALAAVGGAQLQAECQNAVRIVQEKEGIAGARLGVVRALRPGGLKLRKLLLAPVCLHGGAEPVRMDHLQVALCGVFKVACGRFVTPPGEGSTPPSLAMPAFCMRGLDVGVVAELLLDTVREHVAGAPGASAPVTELHIVDDSGEAVAALLMQMRRMLTDSEPPQQEPPQ